MVLKGVHAMLIEILFIMDMFLWFLMVLPVPAVLPYAPYRGILAWIAVLLLGLKIFAVF
jgi:hypothetical protein